MVWDAPKPKNFGKNLVQISCRSVARKGSQWCGTRQSRRTLGRIWFRFHAGQLLEKVPNGVGRAKAEELWEEFGSDFMQVSCSKRFPMVWDAPKPKNFGKNLVQISCRSVARKGSQWCG